MTRSDAEWELPFEPEEYAARLERTREEMTRKGVDLLYVTSPPNLNYLLGHQSVWCDGRNVTGLAVPLDAAVTPIYVRHLGPRARLVAGRSRTG